MVDTVLIKYLWSSGDNDIVEFALLKARLNLTERLVIGHLLDDCMTQEQTAEKMNLSVIKVQDVWYSACYKLLRIDWVNAYANDLKGRNIDS